jgi:hypothetical protein
LFDYRFPRERVSADIKENVQPPDCARRAVAGGEALRSSFNAAVRGKSTTIERGCDLLA